MTDPQNPAAAPMATAPHQTSPGDSEATPDATADPMEKDQEPTGGLGAVRPDLA